MILCVHAQRIPKTNPVEQWPTYCLFGQQFRRRSRDIRTIQQTETERQREEPEETVITNYSKPLPHGEIHGTRGISNLSEICPMGKPRSHGYQSYQREQYSGVYGWKAFPLGYITMRGYHWCPTGRGQHTSSRGLTQPPLQDGPGPPEHNTFAYLHAV